MRNLFRGLIGLALLVGFVHYLHVAYGVSYTPIPFLP